MTEQFVGKVVVPTSRDYNEARQQYATSSFPEADMSPGLILYAAGDADILQAIELCQKENKAMSVRCGGHQYCGYSSTSRNNIQVDVSETYPKYEYDAANNTLVCGVSHALGDWAALNHKQEIYLPMGVCAHVHLGGHVHTGGWGMVARSHGILADHVDAFDIILANGEKKHVIRPAAGQTDQDNDDLYYAVLGGSNGGCFGVVTQWEFTPIRDRDHPNSACYEFFWIRTEEATRKIVTLLQEYTKKCADGTIPSDYEFMLTITGTGKMNLIRDEVIEELDKLGHLSKDAFGVYVPQLIQLWACYTNKGGAAEEFDETWFEAFADLDVGLPWPRPILSHRRKNTPISYGLAEMYIMRQEREMEYPFVKRFHVTRDLPDSFPASYTEQTEKITGFWGTERGLHLVSQMQIYAGGAVSDNAKNSGASYSWRDQVFALSHDAFYDTGKIDANLLMWIPVAVLHWIRRRLSRHWPMARLSKNAYEHANAWQDENDRVFVGNEGTFSKEDLRMFAYTWGGRELTEEWEKYYDSAEKYERLRRIKAKVDPNNVFSPDTFAISPSEE